MSDLMQLSQQSYTPSEDLLQDITKIDGDILLLGVGGKMGPSMAKLAKQAIDHTGQQKRVIGVSRFSEPSAQKDLKAAGIETIAADLLDEKQLASLPDAKNVIFLAGQKFGTTGNESFTWAMNTYLPGRVAERYRDANIVAFSTGNVYPFSTVVRGGACETDVPEPIGEYGQSCLGRERLFQYFSTKYQIPTLIYRLNYAIDLHYGVLMEVAKMVQEQKSIDLSMGNVNVIWQADANEIALRSLLHCEVPAKILNITGPETVSVRWLANQFGLLFGKDPQFINEERPTALLSNAAQAHQLFGYPKVTLKQMISLTAEWLKDGKNTVRKPTHFQERTGKF
ncbi:NAD(P)-dependent oxidoreductase [Olivibacter sp. SDN3]|uniref:NAD-dependent epimerase/dehydratase family protein n=1 Tax=Olivibacter sp. SDN3 TaxID=2764720 RepID=UPI00165110BD|nr:NAD(P)-dependent oxidoreductase [Olivibacter sp. SDN3]QNL49286.1 NAD(P)-dependent oxidoreductase [Olivibacter sp. SDN3]